MQPADRRPDRPEHPPLREAADAARFEPLPPPAASITRGEPSDAFATLADDPADAEAQERVADFAQKLVWGIITACAGSAAVMTVEALSSGRVSRLVEGVAIAVGGLAAAVVAPALAAALARPELVRRPPWPEESSPSDPPPAG